MNVKTNKRSLEREGSMSPMVKRHKSLSTVQRSDLKNVKINFLDDFTFDDLTKENFKETIRKKSIIVQNAGTIAINQGKI